MVSQDDDSAQRVALFLVFGLIAIVVSSVLIFGVNHRGAPTALANGRGVPAALATGVLAPSGAAQAAADAASVKVEQGVVKFYFASSKADLAAGAGEALTDVIKGAQAGRKLVISGFHDATGNAAQNAELAKQRALAVRNALKAEGVADGQIELRKPEEITSAGSDAQARRVEISLQ